MLENVLYDPETNLVTMALLLQTHWRQNVKISAVKPHKDINATY